MRRAILVIYVFVLLVGAYCYTPLLSVRYSFAVEPSMDAEAYYNRGIAYDNKGEYDRAIADYNKALEINPRHAGAYNNRGLAYYSKGEYDHAIADYNKAIEINPRHAEAYNNRAVAYYYKGEYNKA